MDHWYYKTHEKKMNKVSRQRARGKRRKELALYQVIIDRPEGCLLVI